MDEQAQSLIFFIIFILVCGALLFGIGRGLMKRSKK
ncbi:hypothetical protein Dehly_0809 [Dehalogenimonas lykanthroporepellens BL-DC-9]|nr:hypothetical protein Dehly_0809 [Dehalogenimonas lykanthroporepellens BL-DC-9]